MPKITKGPWNLIAHLNFPELQNIYKHRIPNMVHMILGITAKIYAYYMLLVQMTICSNTQGQAFV